MPSPRYTQIDIEATPYYHCISRCVRRAFLCGDDRRSGANFDHRKDWVVEKLARLTEVFAVRVCAYAILSNHFHLVVRIDSELARDWSDDEVVERYRRLFRSSADPREHQAAASAAERIHCWRARLADLSWFMRCLNEAIARRANLEDGCTGRFWEGRFRCQALLDDAGLLTCMSYVDLNPIRAGIAASLEESEFTSIRQRITERAAEPEVTPAGDGPKDAELQQVLTPVLAGFTAAGRAPGEDSLPMEIEDYIELLTATGVALACDDPRAPLPAKATRTLERAGISSEHWLETIREYHRHFFSMVGCVHRIEIHCARTDRTHAKGSRWAARAFRSCA